MNPFTLRTLIRTLIVAAVAASIQLAHAGQPLVCLIQPSRIAEVGSSVIGIIEDIRVERGDMVKKGQVIAVLRGDVERAALNVAQSRAQAEADVQAAIAALEFAHQSTARAEDLVTKKFVSEQALDKARTEERVAAQRLAQAREQRQVWAREKSLAQSQLAQRTIVSPISGIVAERYLSSGERVEDRSVARIVSINPLHVEVMVPAANFGQIKPGMSATVMPELPDAPPVEARVILVDKLIDGASNTFRVRLELPNPDHAIPAGPRCKVAFGDQVIGNTKGASKPGPLPGISRVSMISSAPAKAVPFTPSAPEAITGGAPAR
jgi:RND family efflux transporter MFP subunit